VPPGATLPSKINPRIWWTGRPRDAHLASIRLTQGGHMLRFVKQHREDALYFIAAAYLVGVGLLAGILLAELVRG
jgi:hypothetical protein